MYVYFFFFFNAEGAWLFLVCFLSDLTYKEL